MKEYVLRNKSFKDILKKKIQQTSLKFIWNHQRPQIAKTILTSKTRKNEDSYSQTSIYTTETYYSEQYSIGPKTDTQINETGLNPEINAHLYRE